MQKLFSKASDEETKQELSIMHRSAKRLQNLINQMLDLSKLESGKMELNAAEENIVTLVKSYVQQFESLAKHKKIDLTFTAENKEIIAFLDLDKIEKILYNLLSNSFKFTGAGGRIEVSVSGQQSAVSGRPFIADCRLPTVDLFEQCIVISISDTGAGISPEKLPHIFDRFYQAGDSYTKDGEGTGIGLALTKELVELHGGRITVESVVNQGSTFRIFLPVGGGFLRGERREEKGERRDKGVKQEEEFVKEMLYKECEIQEVERETRNVEPETRNAESLLLIVEDNPDLRRYIRGYLDTTYGILEAEDGQQGLSIAMEQIPDVIISDVMMPKMDGIELCRKVKSDIRTSHIPVILLTARAGIENKLEGLETGADEYLYKPFNPHELIVRVHNMLEQRKKIRDHYIKKMGIAGRFLPAAEEMSFSSLDDQFLIKTRNVVEENLSDPDFSVDGFAKLVGMSRSHLHRKMIALISLSPSDFVRTLRLSRAAQRLKQKSGSVSEIAFDVGFNNLSYFSRCFHEQFGVLPSEYADSK